jgi:hypothetical protein
VSMFAENAIIYRHTKPVLINHEYLLGTFMLAIGMFMLSFNIKTSKDSILSSIGRKYSLMIYLYHPLLILVISFIMKKVSFINSTHIVWLNPVSIFILTLSMIVILNRMYPKVYNVISGKL